MTGATALEGATRLNPPPLRDRTAKLPTRETGDRTDFWRDTLYGVRRDGGHGLPASSHGDFTVHVTFDGDCQALHNTARPILRDDEVHWIKSGIELSDGVANLSVVVTHGASDWSTLARGPKPGPQRLRLARVGGAVVVQAANAANRRQLLRVTPFPEGPAQTGPTDCSPERAGFRARVTEFTIGPAVAWALHDESAAS
jgi:regulation of enolase protein 1 (concanavalin A-like superfamily)